MPDARPSIHSFWMLIALVSLIAITRPLAAPNGAQDQDRQGDDREAREPYAIGLWGDLPYSDVQALTGVPNLIADMNSQDLAFTVHDGDLKAGNGTPGSVTPTICSDALYIQALGFFNHPRPPPILSPGTTTGTT